MTDSLSHNTDALQNRGLLSILKPAKFEKVSEKTMGYVFKDKNFAHDWDSIYVNPNSLDEGEVTDDMRKITAPTLVMASHRSKMAYVLASEEEPVYIKVEPKDWEKNNLNFLMLFVTSIPVIPEYVYYLSKYDSWTHVIHELKDGYHEDWVDVGYVEYEGDSIVEHIIDAEELFLDFYKYYNYGGPNIPFSCEQQRQVIDNARLVEKHIQEKIDKREKKFKEKEWLNEEHIRNSKHKLSGHIWPIRMAVSRLNDYFQQNPNGITLSNIIGQKTNQTVRELLDGLIFNIGKINEEIENLTHSENLGENSEFIELAKFVSDYCQRMIHGYSHQFSIQKSGFECDAKIRISRKELIELIDYIIGNADRHGFIEENEEHIIEFSIETTDDNICRFSIANNGIPMSERGRKEFFVWGSSAGETGHSGIGGARIYEICDKAGGQALPPSSKEGFPVVITMEFPLIK